MSNINAKDVAKLREITGAGMMDCKKVLAETKGDFDKAIELLKKKGVASAAKRSGRTASEGYISSYVHNGKVGVLLELNSETDFVAKNEDFQTLAKDIALQVAGMKAIYISPENIPFKELDKVKETESEKLKKEGKPANIMEKILEGRIEKYCEEVCLTKQTFIKDDKKKIEDLINETITKIGEKIEIGRFIRFEIGRDTVISEK